MTVDRIILHARNVLAIIGLVSLCGCASIVDGKSAQNIRIDSVPSGAQVTIFDKHNWRVDSDTTPFVAKLDRSSGYFAGTRYRLVFNLSGYRTSEAIVESTINGWYFGNIFFGVLGGAIGLVAVDPATGAMWKLHPKLLVQQLDPVPVGISSGSATNVVPAESIVPTAPAEPPVTPPASSDQTQSPPANNVTPSAPPASSEPSSVQPSAPNQ
jgi:hypothetical protein